METTPIKIEELKQKRQLAWGNFGLKLVDIETDLQAKKMEIEKLLSYVPEKSTIAKTEADLKEAKRLSKELEEFRKQTTNHLDSVKARLMEPEKGIADIVKIFEAKIIDVKKIIEQENAAANAKEEEKRDLATKVKASYIEYLAECLRITNETIHNVYSEMLTQKVPVDEFDDFIKNSSDIQIPDYKPFFARQNYVQKHLSDGEKANIYTANKAILPNYRQMFIDEMLAKKAGYRSELANVEAAKSLLEKEKKEAEKKAVQEKEMAQLNLKIENATAVDALPKPEIKELKKAFEIDMPNDYKTVLSLFAAFSANIDICLPELKVNKWMALTPAQVGNVLAKLKTKNNSLEFSGINFKAIDKL